MKPFSLYLSVLMVLILGIGEFALAGQFKMRAREHIETHTIKTATLETTYKGLSNTINLWWEVPYEYAIGLSYSPVLSNLKFGSDTTFGTKVKLEALGIEGKYFFTSLVPKLFTRLGVGSAKLIPNSTLANRSGSFYYIGLGYEVPFKKFGLALEAAYRKSTLSDDTTITSITPSIGFHFYEMF